MTQKRRTLARASFAGLGMLYVVCFSVSASAQASSQSKAVAEALFDEGISLMKSEQYAKACAKLESSERVEPAVGTLLYLGECYARVDRTASAWATFREAASMASENGQTDRATQAKARASELEPKLSYLTISISSEARGLAGLTILRRGETLDGSALGTSLPVDPGKVTVEVKASGYEPFLTTLDVAPQSHSSVDVPMLKALPNASVAPVPQASNSLPAEASLGTARPPLATTPSDTGKTQRVVGLVLMGTGAAGLGVGSYFGLTAMSQNSKAEAGYCSETVCQRSVDLAHADDARKSATISNIAFGAGASAIVAGIITYLLAPSSKQVGLTIQPQFAHERIGIDVGGYL